MVSVVAPDGAAPSWAAVASSWSVAELPQAVSPAASRPAPMMARTRTWARRFERTSRLPAKVSHEWKVRPPNAVAGSFRAATQASAWPSVQFQPAASAATRAAKRPPLTQTLMAPGSMTCRHGGRRHRRRRDLGPLFNVRLCPSTASRRRRCPLVLLRMSTARRCCLRGASRCSRERTSRLTATPATRRQGGAPT